jgi:hypothetical protein
VHSPSVRNARTEYLRAELDRRRVGEDARVCTERAHECRQNIKGWNLDADFGAAAPPSPGNARVDVLMAGVGYTALADHLCTVA